MELTLDSTNELFGQQFKQFIEYREVMQQDRDKIVNARIEPLRIQRDTGREQGSEDIGDLDPTRRVDAASHSVGLGSRNILRWIIAEYGLGFHLQLETNKQQLIAEVDAGKGR